MPSSRFPGRNIVRALGRCAYWTLSRATFGLSVDRGGVVFAGDSLIDQWTTLENDFPGHKTINRGISGDTSRGLLVRLSQDVLACRPSAVVILIGTNDLAAGVPPRRAAASIRRMTEKIRRSGDIPVVLCRVLPRAAEPGLFPEKINELNGLIDRMAMRQQHVSVCDTFAPLANGGGSCREEFFIDGLHLNAAGYRALSVALKPFLSRRNRA